MFWGENIFRTANVSSMSEKKNSTVLYEYLSSLSVALNFQTHGEQMDLNQGRFLPNGRCGYILKPSFLCQPDSEFNPENTGGGPGHNPTLLTIKVGCLMLDALCYCIYVLHYELHNVKARYESFSQKVVMSNSESFGRLMPWHWSGILDHLSVQVR